MMGIEMQMTESRPNPLVKPLLYRDTDREIHQALWKYCLNIGMMNYLLQRTMPDIVMAVFNVLIFCNDPTLSHDWAVKGIARNLLGTIDNGISNRPDSLRGLECFSDTKFACGWERGDSDNPENVMSQTGYNILYATAQLSGVANCKQRLHYWPWRLNILHSHRCYKK